MIETTIASQKKPKQPDPTPIRMPGELKIWLKHQAVDNDKSLNSEIVDRLEESRRLQQKKDLTHERRI